MLRSIGSNVNSMISPGIVFVTSLFGTENWYYFVFRCFHSLIRINY